MELSEAADRLTGTRTELAKLANAVGTAIEAIRALRPEELGHRIKLVEEGLDKNTRVIVTNLWLAAGMVLLAVVVAAVLGSR